MPAERIFTFALWLVLSVISIAVLPRNKVPFSSCALISVSCIVIGLLILMA